MAGDRPFINYFNFCQELESTELKTFFNVYDISKVNHALEYNWRIPAIGSESALVIFISRLEIIEFTCPGCCVASAVQSLHASSQV